MDRLNIFENTRLQLAVLAVAVLWLLSWPIGAYRDYRKTGNTAKYVDLESFKPLASLGNNWKLASDRGPCNKETTLKYEFAQQIVAVEPALTKVVGHNASYRLGSNLLVMEFDVLQNGVVGARSKLLFKATGKELKLLGNLTDSVEKYVPADAEAIKSFHFTKCGKST